MRYYHKRDTSIDILRRRFAAGKITKEEYKERKKILENDLAKKAGKIFKKVETFKRMIRLKELLSIVLEIKRIKSRYPDRL